MTIIIISGIFQEKLLFFLDLFFFLLIDLLQNIRVQLKIKLAIIFELSIFKKESLSFFLIAAVFFLRIKN